MSPRTPLLACLALLGVCACGNTSTGFQYTAVADSTVVSALTDGEATDLCVAMVEHYDASLGAQALARNFCLGMAVAGTSTESECNASRTTCEASVALDAPTACAASITSVRSRCSATVAEIERCIDDTTALLGTALGGSCSDAPTISDVSGTRYDSSSPPSCAILDGGCSELVLQSGRSSP